MTLLLAGLAMAPGVAWFHGLVLVALGLGSRFVPHRGWHAAGAGLLLVDALAGPWGQPLAVACLLGLVAVVRARAQAWREEVPGLEALALGRVAARTRAVADALVHDRTTLASSPIGFVAVFSAGAALAVIPQVWPDAVPGGAGVVGTLSRALLASGGAICAAELLPAPSVPARALWLGGAVPLLRLVAMFRLQGEALVAEADALRAVHVVYDRLAQRADPALLTALVRAVPDRDEAALALGWDAALGAGWRPRAASGVEVPVARALAARGRAGEAFALLGALPRVGAVDWELALLERLEGRPVGWMGGRVAGPVLPGEVAIDRVLVGDGDVHVEFTALSPCGPLLAHVASDDGLPVQARVRHDGRVRIEEEVAEEVALPVTDTVDAGPHRVRVSLGEAAPRVGARASLRVRALSCATVAQAAR